MNKSIEKVLLEIRSQIGPDRVSHAQALAIVDRFLDEIAAFRERLATSGERYVTQSDKAERERIILDVVRSTPYGRRNKAIENAIQQAKEQGRIR